MRRAVSALAVLVAVLVAGCGEPDSPVPPPETPAPAPQDDASDDAQVEDEPAPVPELDAVATLSPIADLVATVGGARVAVSSLVPAGADSHTYEPRPSDVARLVEADAYLGIGLGLNDAALRLAEEHLPEGAPVLRLGEAIGDDLLVFDHAHGDEHTHADGTTHTHADGTTHSHGDDGQGPNPHVWTSLRNAALLVEGIAEALISLDPDGAEGYSARAAAYRAELEALDARIGDAVASIPAEHRTLVTYHDAWIYFARDHGLEFVAAVQPSDYADPSAAEVRAVIELIRELEVPAVFGSEVFPSGVLETIAAETGATYHADLADDVLPGEPDSPEHTYLELMRRNAVLIVEALGGDASGL